MRKKFYLTGNKMSLAKMKGVKEIVVQKEHKQRINRVSKNFEYLVKKEPDSKSDDHKNKIEKVQAKLKSLKLASHSSHFEQRKLKEFEDMIIQHKNKIMEHKKESESAVG